MNSAPHLLPEDRPQFERILDQALRSLPAGRPAAAPTGGASPAASRTPPNTEQLRTLALDAASAIAGCAAEEYGQLLRVREAQAVHASGDRSTAAPGTPEAGAAGAGLVPTAAVLVPLLAGTAAVVFLAAGCLLGTLDPVPEVAAPLRVAGWTFLVLAGAGVLTGTVGMLLTALRDGSSAIHADGPVAPDAVAAARDAWAAALLDRGILPFLREIRAPGEDGSPHAESLPAPQARPSREGDARRTAGERRGGRRRFGSRRPDAPGPDATGPEEEQHGAPGGRRD